MPSTKPFLSFVIDPKLLRRLNNYRFRNKFPSRAAAIIFLIEQGITPKASPLARKVKGKQYAKR